MYGYTGRILYVELKGQEFRIESFGEVFAKKYRGGNGFAAKILYDGLRKAVDPFSPENLVVFAVGPVTDYPLPSTSRAYVATKSPLSGLFFDSTFGGRFAITQKRTGFEAIVISGKAASPVYLVIDESGSRVQACRLPLGKTDEGGFRDHPRRRRRARRRGDHREAARQLQRYWGPLAVYIKYPLPCEIED